MGKPIRIGDLVQVVRPSRCPVSPNSHLGHTYIVRKIISPPAGACCAICGRVDHLTQGLYAVSEERKGFPFTRLLRIDPPPVSEGSRTDAKVGEFA